MEIVASAALGMRLHYRSQTQTVLVSFPVRPTDTAFLCETRAQVDAVFDAVTHFWRANCHGQKMYWVVDYRNFSFHPACAGEYATRLKEFMELASITVVRYGGTQEHRSLVRASTQQVHVPTNLYNTREEALEVIAGLRAGFIRLGPREVSGSTWLGTLLGAVLLSLVACSHPQLSDAGRQVLLVSTPPPSGCEPLGRLVGHAYGTFLYGDTLQTPALNDLVNQAALQGATHVQLLGTDPSAHACRARGIALQCK